MIEAFVEHIETGERRSVMVSEGQFLSELKLTRLRTKRHGIRVARGDELGGSVPFSGKVIMKEDVELDDLPTAVEAAQRLYKDGGVIDPAACWAPTWPRRPAAHWAPASTPPGMPDLAKGTSDTIRADLMEADVVLLEIPQGDANPAFPTAISWRGLDPADCGGDDHQQCLRDYVTGNKASVEAIFFELTAICDPTETLIRALDVYMLEVEDTNALGKLHILNPYLQETQEYLEVTAAQHGIPVAQVYDAFMGPDGTNVPQDAGLVMSDARHPTEVGSLLIAQMLHDLGYDLAS
ncbi:MAG: hypothetical protein HKM89_05630 [Gemmatimonadales bacterium]|nr:hypothetical protein [Gemmatimonadales bacterium]